MGKIVNIEEYSESLREIMRSTKSSSREWKNAYQKLRYWENPGERERHLLRSKERAKERRKSRGLKYIKKGTVTQQQLDEWMNIMRTSHSKSREYEKAKSHYRYHTGENPKINKIANKINLDELVEIMKNNPASSKEYLNARRKYIWHAKKSPPVDKRPKPKPKRKRYDKEKLAEAIKKCDVNSLEYRSLMRKYNYHFGNLKKGRNSKKVLLDRMSDRNLTSRERSIARMRYRYWYHGGKEKMAKKHREKTTELDVKKIEREEAIKQKPETIKFIASELFEICKLTLGDYSSMDRATDF